MSNLYYIYNIIFVITIAALIFTTRYLAIINLRLYAQNYGKHLIFEGLADNSVVNNSRLLKQIHRPIYKNLIWLADIINFGLILFTKFYLINYFSKIFYSDFNYFSTTNLSIIIYTAKMLLAMLIMNYVILIGGLIPGIIVFKFTIKFPGELSGQTYFKSKLVKILQHTILIPSLIAMIALVIMNSSPYIFGGILANVLTLLITYKKHPIY